LLESCALSGGGILDDVLASRERGLSDKHALNLRPKYREVDAMPDPATQAAKRRWSAAHKERQRQIWRDWARNRDPEAMREIRRRYEDDHRAARDLRNRCKVSIKVARRWIAEGRVPPYERPGRTKR
jgi:hypothetical protein